MEVCTFGRLQYTHLLAILYSLISRAQEIRTALLFMCLIRCLEGNGCLMLRLPLLKYTFLANGNGCGDQMKDYLIGKIFVNVGRIY